MTPSQLNREVAKVTRESVRTIAKLGFMPLSLTPTQEQHDEPSVVDWDELASERDVVYPIPQR